MAGSVAWDLFRDRAHAEIVKHQNRILSGRLTEEQYKREAGWIDGALAVLSLPTQIGAEYMAARGRFEEDKAAEEEDAA